MPCRFAALVLAAIAPAASADEPPRGLRERLLSASPERGFSQAAVCLACHTAEQGAGPLIGPNLFGVVGRAPGSHPDYPRYTPAMTAYRDSLRTWSLPALDTYLAAPMAVVPGTTMVFPGLSDPAVRADVLSWLSSLR